ncbi:MAG: epoxyqueuosine reductase QueH [Coprobacter sp.]|nr:epoxyqueuosine reductase QueH [Coprobacter sp.]
MKPRVNLEVPGGADRVLLHCCCAPCSSAIVECLLDNGVRPTLYFYNPNIYPEEEYQRRKSECVRHATLLGLEVIDADYEHERWLGDIRGLEHEPERGARCLRCFVVRLRATALYAATHGYGVITTTLASSRWKVLDQINEAGRSAVADVPDVIFWEQNWRRGGLQERRRELIAEYAFYNQTYCGCEYSMRGDENK